MNLLMVTFSLVLLGTMILSFSNFVRFDTSEGIEQQYTMVAIGLAQSIIDEAKLKAFDRNTVGAPAKDSSSLTPFAELGPDAGEPKFTTMVDTLNPAKGYLSSLRYNDVDDYHNYRRVMSKSFGYEGDTLLARVRYAHPLTLDSVGVRTYSKVMTVIVRSKYLSAPVSLSYGFTY